MKTIECKIQLTNEQKQFFKEIAPELSWIWNLGLELLIEYHCFSYYDWITKKSKEKGIDLEGIDKVYLRLPKHNAWSLPMQPEQKKYESWLREWKKDQTQKFVSVGGAQCQIAIFQDGVYTPIEKKMLPLEPRLKKHGKSIQSIYMTVTGYLTKARCDEIRQKQGLPPLKVPSAYMKGLYNRLAISWAAYLDSNRRESFIPKFKHQDVKTFNSISPESINIRNNKLYTSGLTKQGIRFVNNNHLNRLSGEIRSLVIKQEPSGWYACLTIEEPIQVQINQLIKANRRAKDEQEKTKILEQINTLKNSILSSDKDHHKQTKKRAIGIEVLPTGKVITDGGQQIHTPKVIDNYAKKLARLQRSLSRKELARKRSGKLEQSNNYKKTKQRIAKIHEKIRRRRDGMMNKTCAYLSRFHAIAWKNFPIKKMMRAPKAELNSNRSYKKTGRSKTADFRRRIADSAIGSLKVKLDNKTSAENKDFFLVPYIFTEQEICHCCGKEGNSTNQSFYCKNTNCTLHGVQQNAGTNAARVTLLNSGFLQSGKYHPWDWYDSVLLEDIPLGVAFGDAETRGKSKPVGKKKSSLSPGDVPGGETAVRRSTRQEAGSQTAPSSDDDQLPFNPSATTTTTTSTTATTQKSSKSKRNNQKSDTS